MSLGLLIALSLALGLAAWLFFLWTVKSGQYDDAEGAKYRMLQDEEGERPPAAPGEPPGAAADGGREPPRGAPPPGSGRP